MSENNFRIAFGVQNYYDKESKDDENYVRWTAELVTMVKGVRSTKYLDYHKCSEEDFSLFNQVAEQSKKVLNQLKENQVLYCIDSE